MPLALSHQRRAQAGQGRAAAKRTLDAASTALASLGKRRELSPHGCGIAVEVRGAPLAGRMGGEGCEHANGGPQGRRRAQQTPPGGRGINTTLAASRLAKDPRWRRSRERADGLLSGAGLGRRSGRRAGAPDITDPSANPQGAEQRGALDPPSGAQRSDWGKVAEDAVMFNAQHLPRSGGQDVAGSMPAGACVHAVARHATP